jgi:hypothetical protein
MLSGVGGGEGGSRIQAKKCVRCKNSRIWGNKWFSDQLQFFGIFQSKIKGKAFLLSNPLIENVPKMSVCMFRRVLYIC